jgi:hypothetical protein
MPVSIASTPRYLVTPQRSGTYTSEIALNGDLTTATDQPIIGLRVLVDPGDDVTAADALLSGAGCRVITPDSSLTLDLAAGCKAIYVIGIGSAAIPADYTGGAFVISINETDSADALAQLCRFDLNYLDTVKTVTISLSATWSSGLAARVFMEAYSHA